MSRPRVLCLHDDVDILDYVVACLAGELEVIAMTRVRDALGTLRTVGADGVVTAVLLGREGSGLAFAVEAMHLGVAAHRIVILTGWLGGGLPDPLRAAALLKMPVPYEELLAILRERLPLG